MALALCDPDPDLMVDAGCWDAALALNPDLTLTLSSLTLRVFWAIGLISEPQPDPGPGPGLFQPWPQPEPGPGPGLPDPGPGPDRDPDLALADDIICGSCRGVTGTPPPLQP
jgi:hypothetical protein